MFQPLNQVRLTNVCVVRLKKKGKRFELACYPNKVLDWRKKIEKDLDEVLQTDSVFTNVSKGAFASAKDMKHAFGTDDQHKIALLILEKGDLQVTSKERAAEATNLLHDIATIVVSKCINSETNRPFTVTMIETAMKEIQFTPNPKRPAKVQALEVSRLLAETMPISRAQMRIRIECPKKNGKEFKKAVEALVGAFEEEEWGLNYLTTVLLDPGNYREFEETFLKHSKGQGTMEILDLKVQEAGELAL